MRSVPIKQPASSLTLLKASAHCKGKLKLQKWRLRQRLQSLRRLPFLKQTELSHNVSPLSRLKLLFQRLIFQFCNAPQTRRSY